MLEQMYSNHAHEHLDLSDTGTRTMKRRKADIISGLDDDDLPLHGSTGKKQKGGIGYAGDMAEDVSFLYSTRGNGSLIFLFASSIRVNLKHRQHKRPRMRRSASCCRRSGRICPT